MGPLPLMAGLFERHARGGKGACVCVFFYYPLTQTSESAGELAHAFVCMAMGAPTFRRPVGLPWA